MSYWPASVPPGKREPATTVARGSLRRIALGAVRLVSWWPGLVVVFLAYGAVAIGLAGHLYNNLWGGVAAIVVGVGWYASPLRQREAKRRERLRDRLRAAGARPPVGPTT